MIVDLHAKGAGAAGNGLADPAHAQNAQSPAAYPAAQKGIAGQIHVTDPTAYSSYALSLSLYQAIYRNYPDRFAYKQPPYEYEHERLPVDLILGDRQIRSQIEAGTALPDIISGWKAPLADYIKMIKEIQIYG